MISWIFKIFISRLLYFKHRLNINNTVYLYRIERKYSDVNLAKIISLLATESDTNGSPFWGKEGTGFVEFRIAARKEHRGL